MAAIFYMLGWLAVAIGALLVGASFVGLGALMNSLGGDAASGLSGSSFMTGLSIMFGGLMIIAIGGVLARLDRIVRNTRPTEQVRRPARPTNQQPARQQAARQQPVPTPEQRQEPSVDL